MELSQSIMKLLSILVFTSLGTVWAQTAPASGQALLPDIPGEKVIARFDDGAEFTMDQLRQLYPVLPPQLQGAVTKDPVEFFREYALMRRHRNWTSRSLTRMRSSSTAC